MANKTVQPGALSGNSENPERGRSIGDTTDELIGAPGTPARDEYEDLLQRKIVSAKLREYRTLHKLSQAELGERIGVQRNQICKLERDSSNITLSTLFKVFRALGIGIKLSFEAPPPKLAKLAVFAIALLLTYNKSPAAPAGAFLCFYVY